MEMSLLVLYLLLPFPSVVLRASPYFIWDTKRLSLLHTPWCLLNSSTWKSLGCFKRIQHFPIIYVSDKLFLTNCLGSLRGTWFEKAFSFPSNIFGSSSAPHFISARVSTLRSRAKFFLFNIHMLGLLPCGFSSLRNINISNNPSLFKTLSTSITAGTHLRSIFIITETFEPVS